jgi:hypothetical protein
MNPNQDELRDKFGVTRSVWRRVRRRRLYLLETRLILLSKICFWTACMIPAVWAVLHYCYLMLRN